MQSIKARKTQMWLTNALVTVSVCLFGSSYLHTLIDFGLQYLSGLMVLTLALTLSLFFSQICIIIT